MIEQGNDWQRKVIETAEATIEAIQPELIAIVKDVVQEHGVRFPRPEVAAQAAALFNDIQTRSFQLGIKTGIEMVMKTLDMRKPGRKMESPL